MSDSFASSWTVAFQAPLSMEFSRQEYWSGLPFPSPGDLPTQESNSRLLHRQADSLPLSHLGNPAVLLHLFYFSLMLIRTVPDTYSVQSLRHVPLFVTPWITARQAFLSITNSQSSLRFMSIKSVMPSSHLILCRPLLLLPPIPPSIRVFSNESTLHMRWPKYWSFSFSIILPKKSQGWSPSEWTGWISLQSKGLSRVFSNTTVQKHKRVLKFIITKKNFFLFI